MFISDRFHTEQARETMGTHFYGRRLYEAMRYWETAEENPSAPEYELEFARIWKETPKVVFSRTLERVEGNATLARGNIAEEVARLKEQPGKDMAVGGAGLASSFIKLGLIDEYRLFVHPVVLGGGTPYFPPLDERINLQLVETRTFGSKVVYVRYRRLPDGGPPFQS
jgi:dihydrofolate reductase